MGVARGGSGFLQAPHAPLKSRDADLKGSAPNARLKRVESRIFQHALYMDERLLRRFQLTCCIQSCIRFQRIQPGLVGSIDATSPF